MTGRSAGASLAAALLLLGSAAAAQPADLADASTPDAGEAQPDASTPAPVEVADAGVAPVSLAQPGPPPIEFGPPESPARVQLSETLLAAFHLDNGNIAPQGSAAYDPTGSNYFDWLNKLQLDAAWNGFTAALRVDSALFVNAPVADPSDVRLQQLLSNRYANRFEFEKVFLAWSSQHLDVTLGDSYVTWGRGLVLALRKVDEFGIDTTVRGLSATGRVGGLTVNALGGFSNIVNVDSATGREADNPYDAILGGRIEYRFGKWVTAGVDASHVIYALNANGQPNTPGVVPDQVTSFSGTLELPHLGRFGTLFAEFAAQRRLTLGSELWSTAFYGSASVWLGPLTLLLEFKDYRNYSGIPTSLDPTQVPELALSNFYTAAPTLERVQQVVLNNTDVSGGHLRASVKVLPALVPFVSMAVFSDRLYQTLIFDPYAGVELRWNEAQSRASASGGYRLNQYSAGSVAPGTPFQGEWHVELDVNQHLVGPYSLEVSGLHLSHHDAQGPNYVDWHEGQVYVSFKQAELWSAALGFEYYTEAPQSIRPYYFNANATWHIWKNLLVRLFVGGQRAGIKCVNGVCRNFPAFDGARLEVVAKY